MAKTKGREEKKEKKQGAKEEKKKQENRQEEIKKLTAEGTLPVEADVAAKVAAGEEITAKQRAEAMPLLMGQAAAAISSTQPAKQIMEEMVAGAVRTLRTRHAQLSRL